MPSSSRPGFALPAVLAVTGVVTLVFLVAITALASLTAEAGSARARVRFLTRAMTAEARIEFLVASQPLSPAGVAIGGVRMSDALDIDPAASLSTSIATVRLDSRTYAMEVDGPIGTRLQDQAGLINLNTLDDARSRRLADLLGVDAGFAARLAPRLTDYVDVDGLRGVNGAEQSDYGGGLPPNRFLLRPAEWLSILGVRGAVNADRWRALRNDLATDPTQRSLNVNTMTPAAMQVLLGLSPQQARTSVRARGETPFLSFQAFQAVSGVSIIDDGERLYTFPDGRIIYTFSDPNSSWTYRGRITLTPGGLEQPLWIDQTELTEAPRRARADLSDATPIPDAPD